MELSMEGGMRAYIQRIIAAKSQLELVKLFKDVVLKSYGKKSADGRLFMKNDAIRAEFEAHPVYSMIYMDLVTDEAKASAFVNGIMPADMPNQNPAMEMAATVSAACTERSIGTGLISSDIFPLWRREAAPGNFRAAFIFFTPSGADAPAPSKREPFKGAHLRAAQGE